MNFDFHCHSNASDGVLAPSALAQRAASNGVEHWALTDHDVLTGLAEARATAAQLSLSFYDGIEISITWRGQTIHIVGLDIDPSNAALIAGIEGVRSERGTRAERIADQLTAAGIPGTLAGAYRYADDPQMVGRTHFARYLVEVGRAPDVAAVFQHYLSPGKPGYIEHSWATLAQAVDWIRAAGGLAIIAHPGRYK